MANVCDNTFYACLEDEESARFVSDFLEKHFNAEVDLQVDELFAYFDSKWTFPEELMQELFEAIPNKTDLYMRCLSVEYGCLYHALWVCDEEGWKEY